MPLLSLAKADPETVATLSVQQLVAASGQGDLLDNSLCSQEFRAYLSEAKPTRLADYARHCLSSALPKGGQILQDVVNELGRRLGYEVENGRYSGVVNAIGYDGLWKFSNNPSLIIEVKTTDAYRLSLDKIAGYRKKLIEADACSDDASILIVVGREDTGELEAQIRGSRHAWSVRLISVESLIKLVAVKADIGSPTTDFRIRNLLQPAEYTRLDSLVDVVFSAAKEIDEQPDEPNSVAVGSPVVISPTEATFEFTPAAELHTKRVHVVLSLERKFDRSLLRESRATYQSADSSVRAVVSLSKRYSKPLGRPYWYAYHPSWDEFLGNAQTAIFVVAMMDRQEVYALPATIIRPLLSKLNTTVPPSGKKYWHIHVLESDDGNLSLYVPGAQSLPLAQYRLNVI